MRDERIPEMSEKEIDDYLDGLEEPKKSTLAQLRETIVAIVPDAEEGISYGVPAFKLRGKVIAGFAAYKDHLSYLPHSGSVARRHARTGTNSRIGTSSNSARACLATCSMVPVGTMVPYSRTRSSRSAGKASDTLLMEARRSVIATLPGVWLDVTCRES